MRSFGPKLHRPWVQQCAQGPWAGGPAMGDPIGPPRPKSGSGHGDHSNVGTWLDHRLALAWWPQWVNPRGPHIGQAAWACGSTTGESQGKHRPMLQWGMVGHNMWPPGLAHSRCTSGPGHKHVPGALQHYPNGQCTAMATNVNQCSPAWASLDACPRGKAPGQQHQVGPVPTHPRARLTEAVRSTQERAEQSAACAPKASQETEGSAAISCKCKRRGLRRREKHTRMCEK
jgi:hypothetical protein